MTQHQNTNAFGLDSVENSQGQTFWTLCPSRNVSFTSDSWVPTRLLN